MRPLQERAVANAVVVSEHSGELRNIANAAREVSGQLYHDIFATWAMKAKVVRQHKQGYSLKHPSPVV